jgi:large subunit ribosomal protein L32
MPVPKKRVGHSEQGHRRSCWKATTPTMTRCSNCGVMRHTHTICQQCGHYRGRFYTAKFVNDPVES